MHYYLLPLTYFLILTLSISISVNATNITDKIDNQISKIRTQLNINSAIAIAVIDNEKIIYQRTTGYADIEHNILANDETLFYIASITKPLFAQFILQILEKSQYSLDTTLAQMFPEIKFHSEIKANKVTIKHLLSHTSGLQDNFLTNALSITGIHNKQLTKSMLSKLYSNTEKPLGQFQYTNLGYNIVSLWYENTFNIPWQTAIKHHLLTPLKMTHTTALRSEAKQQKLQIAKPYSYFSLEPTKALYLEKQDNTLHAAGGLLSSIEDMARFVNQQLTPSAIPNLKNNTKLSHKSLANVNSKRGDFERTTYGLGWYKGQYKKQVTMHHFGSFDGFRPHLSFMPNKGIGIVILNNEGMFNDKVTDVIADYIYGILLEEDDIEQTSLQRIAALSTMAKSYREKFITKEQSYHNRPLDLTKPINQYTGTYHHAMAGNVIINYQQEHFTVTWGNLHATATAYKETDVLRIKLRPSHGQLIRFIEYNSGISALTLDGITFKKR
ncbi:serine hydrolase domain-containing protein [Thalassotalea sediminis]|uniref:serine hydrolase domain-containing protein n=1 Tax=Thalassotalea sediminis TaxID=1759089 RepID=UPI0025744320|nr:serine hydrolase domain-containing protein [Thalassotalea sediminis]